MAYIMSVGAPDQAFYTLYFIQPSGSNIEAKSDLSTSPSGSKFWFLFCLRHPKAFPIPVEELKPLVAQKGDIFKSEELTVKTKFGEYIVASDIFTAKSYNSFIQKIVSAVSEVPVRISNRNITSFPTMQINSALIAKLTDDYIGHRLFTKDFNPLEDNKSRHTTSYSVDSIETYNI